jgi:DNA-binding CsgD family transcriptional regulator
VPNRAICVRLRAWHGARVGWRPDLHRIRVLGHLPAKLSAPEIADQLYLSVNVVKTARCHVYDMLGAYPGHEAVEQARARPAGPFWATA